MHTTTPLTTEVSEFIREITERNPELAAAVNTALEQPHIIELLNQLSPFVAVPLLTGRPVDPDKLKDAIILALFRPVYTIVNNRIEINPDDIKTEYWTDRLTGMGTWLKGAAPAIGRIDMENHLYWKKYAGTGWFITNSIVVTNRHVALEFAEKIKASYKMKKGTNNKEIKVSIGLLHEDGITDSVDVPVQEVLYIAPEQDEDIAFLQTSSIEDTGFRSLDYSTNPPETDAEVMVIGFPYWDGDRNDVEVMQKVFRYLYGTKRVAPGTITGVTEKTITHNCSTLSGNSGSPVIEITTGKVVAVHYYGLYEKTNFAVPMKRVAEMLQPFTEDSIFS